MIPDQDKTREQLIAELNELRQKVNFFPQPESAGGRDETTADNRNAKGERSAFQVYRRLHV